MCEYHYESDVIWCKHNYHNWIYASHLMCQSGFFFFFFCVLMDVVHLGSRDVAMSNSSCVFGSLYFSWRYPRTLDLIDRVRSKSSSCTATTDVSKRWRTGFTEMFTYCSPDRASVKSVSGLSVLLSASRTSTSCHVGTRCLVYRSEERTCEIAGSCSSTLWTIACLEPHLVGHSILSLCSGSLSSFWASASSLFRLQL